MTFPTIALLLATTFSASPGPAPQAPEDANEARQQEPERLKAWPATKKAAVLRKEIALLRKGSTEGMIEKSSAALREFGAAAAPLLIEALGSSTLAAEKHAATTERLVGILDEITGAAHTRLIAAEFQSKSPRVRRWALMRAGAFPDEGLLKAAEQALANEVATPLEQFPDLPYQAAMTATSSGSLKGLDALYERSIQDWGKVGTSIRSALERVRGDAASAKFASLAGDKDRSKAVAALRMLAGCGTQAAIPSVRPHLKSKDASLLIAAINACRGIVDKDPPLARMSVFQAVERAKPWIERL